MGIKYHQKYCSYFPLLVKALQEVKNGDVLELGGGPSSTFFLHWMTLDQDRRLYTFENSEYFYKIISVCTSHHHSVHFVENWDEIKFDTKKSWGVVFIDLAPAINRKDFAKKLMSSAQVILLHDSQGLSDKHYKYKEIYPLFNYVYPYTKARPHTTALSNFVDVTKWGL